jgi:hypothetical protein
MTGEAAVESVPTVEAGGASLTHGRWATSRPCWSWAIGLEATMLFRVTTAASPSRLIVDFESD